jgi:hypothetical protein
MFTRNFGIATLVAAMTLGVLGISSVYAQSAQAQNAKPETVEVVGNAATGCTTTYEQLYDGNGQPYSAVTMTCPRPTIRVATLRHS